VVPAEQSGRTSRNPRPEHRKDGLPAQRDLRAHALLEQERGANPRPRDHAPEPPVFDYSQDFNAIDFRKHHELYRIGKGEQGVLLVEPYKGEILPHWRFKTVAEAQESPAEVFRMFLAYLKADDFPGADTARKSLPIGWTRARRYANHRGGRKCDEETGAELPRAVDAEKAEAAAVFYERYVAARQHPDYIRQKQLHRDRYEGK
jgi:hypothetical protein